MSEEYLQKLKNPKWQKKRLEIFERDEWKCLNCGSSEDTLHVHHKKYFYGIEPWDYDNKYLETLCESCHYNKHNVSKLGKPFIIAQFSYDELISLGIKPVSEIKANINGKKFINFFDEETKGIIPIYFSGLACELYDEGEKPSKLDVIIYLMETQDDSFNVETETMTPKGTRSFCIRLIPSLENYQEFEIEK